MEAFGKALNWVKDAGIAAADWVKAHNWLTLGIIAALVALAVLF